MLKGKLWMVLALAGILGGMALALPRRGTAALGFFAYLSSNRHACVLASTSTG